MIWKFIILAIIIFIKAIFSASDTAFTYLNKAKFNQMSKHTNKKSEKKIIKIKEMLDHKLKLFGTTRVGMTLAELFASVFAAEAFVGVIAQKLGLLGMSITLQYILAIIVVTFILSYFTLVFGELLPKRIARNNPEKIAYKTINILIAFSKINTIFEKLLNTSERFFAKLFGIKNESNEKLKEREIKLIIAEGKDQGIFDIDEKKLLNNALKFDNLKIKHVMMPKEKITYINIADDKDKIFKTIKKSKYTRIPVYEKNKDHIIGVLNIKDILLQIIDNQECTFEIRKMLRDPIFVTKEDKIDKVLHNMQLNNKHIAIVKDKENKVEGMLTMEDIIEKLVGNILDEFDK